MPIPHLSFKVSFLPEFPKSGLISKARIQDSSQFPHLRMELAFLRCIIGFLLLGQTASYVINAASKTIESRVFSVR